MIININKKHFSLAKITADEYFHCRLRKKTDRSKQIELRNHLTHTRDIP
jgi:hypothetical protein